ncbi:hypothetical protein FHX42_000126 [Saccharopolyspora lacisalsi]|uniref:Uncharacterized protein n=1 Tax=Halosaccharopolyspora lacisalsi TaxID=1000566 RepID=A0A839DTR9_9PSEU|nr:glucosyltransferase [Halosaccharopolyspora lacisalsi]MBA8822797.1 hypothetical protein [Halosaccharopolyspora lacisalsi]
MIESTRAEHTGAGATPAPAGSRKGYVAGVVALCTAWALTATWLQIVRGPGLLPRDVVWGEDGGVFLNQAMRHSWWHNLFVPHAGYLQVVARIVAEPASLLPVSWAATWLAAGAAFVVASISVLVWFASGRVVRSVWARGLLTALVPLLPQAGYEVIATACNLHWYLAYAAFWVLLVPPRTVRGQLGGAFVVVLAALSDPLAGIVLPAAAVGMRFASRRRVAAIAPAAMIVALAVQVWVHFTGAVGYRASPTSLWDLPQIYAVRVVLSALTGDRLLEPVYVRIGLAGVAVVGLVVLAGTVAAWWRADRRTRFVTAVSLVISVAYLCAPLFVRGTGGYLDYQRFWLGGSRYTIVPLLLLWTAVIVLLDRFAQRCGPRPTRFGVNASALVGTLTAVFLGVQLLHGWAAPSVRSGGPSWSAEVREARLDCRTPVAARDRQRTVLVGDYEDGHSVAIVPAADQVTIVTAPEVREGEALLFGVVVPCSRLR